MRQLELFDKEDWRILLEAEEYFSYLQKPNESFSNMPVCPFLKVPSHSPNFISTALMNFIFVTPILLKFQIHMHTIPDSIFISTFIFKAAPTH